MSVICFHNPNEENGFLSNWYPSCFVVDGTEFTSMEQFMMCRKAGCFHDEKTATQILNTQDVAQIKKLGRLVTGYDDHYWSGIRQIVVYDGLFAKFTQNCLLRKELEGTGDAILAECAVKDCVWGIGLSMSNPDRFNRAKWKGSNLLGYTLMMVRDRL